PTAELLRQLYVDEGLTMRAIAKRWGCGASTVGRQLHRLAISVRRRGPVPSSQRRTRSDITRLEWTAETAWLVGLIATDGNLATTRTTLTISSNDIDLLESVAGALGVRSRISPTRGGWGHRCHRLQWYDRPLYDWLIAIGLTPRKSLTLGPLAIPDE